MNYDKLREQMVKQQLIPKGITDKRVLNAMLKVPRHLFVPSRLKSFAYNDSPLSIAHGQTISQPYMVAVMTEYLRVEPNCKILEIGTGSGYQTAILAELAKSVYTIERIKPLSEKAKKILDNLGYTNIKFKTGDGTLGWAENLPFDRIIVTAASPDIPEPLKKQLASNGIIVIPTGDRYTQILKILKKQNNKFTEKDTFFCAFVPLIGKFGWKGD